ncbi:N-acetylglucosamine kinase [Deinococcus peraridilitoris]|uniref:Putative N-acetylglucosamine kinase n=1 Tax=Deinococcus peraridilitoris (strain DSM 19664 / LMG 22246 / CIP 109416 / KR-200) TaxID=937777 RepID=L0A0D5_DEIPD|nr:BadF/BadG/BcrA/BcrD ATPase family protein [Deinococcus peraridilitoris]AFZ67306.1 putative N-acetylglucosamine kinase [Deinococcus peraridilitoris DSM 19664]
MTYAVGVDAGGTHTRALLTQHAQVLGEGHAGGGNLRQVGPAQVMANLEKAVQNAFERANLPASLSECAVHAGVAGLATPEDERALQDTGHPFGQLQVQSDALLTLGAYFAGEGGALLLVGTGCIALARNAQGDVLRRMGWGFPLEQGGGGDLGLQALRLGLRDWENSRVSALSTLLQRRFTSAREVLEWSRGRAAGDYAQFAPLLFEAATAGDQHAQRAVTEWRDLCQELLEEVTRDSKTELVGTWGGLATQLDWPEREPQWRAARCSPLQWAAALAQHRGVLLASRKGST